MNNSRPTPYARLLLLTAACFFLTLASASAHTAHGTGWAAGFLHPWSGWDHLLALFAVGLWASQSGLREGFIYPLTFLVAMALGGLWGMSGMGLAGFEVGILLSLVGFGALIATGSRIPLVAGMLIAAAFALFHGYAHGVEMPSGNSATIYSFGFLVSSAAISLLGVSLGLALRKLHLPVLVRWCGVSIVVVAAIIAIS